MIKAKWLIYTVIIGLIPFLVRAFLYIVIKKTEPNYIFNASDMVVFGLVLNLSNINELEDNEKIDRLWKTTCIGASTISIILFATFLVVTYFSELDNAKILDINNLKIFIGISCIFSFIFSYAIFNRLNKENHD